MPILELGKLRYGARLLAEVTALGTYEEDQPHRNRKVIRPKFDVSRLMIFDDNVILKNHKTAGVVKASFDAEVFSVASRHLEYQDGRGSNNEFTLTKAQQLSLRNKHQSGLPCEAQLAWSRLIRGPLSPTLEQEVGRYVINTGDGGTITITNPVSGNLLVICHGYYWRGSSPGEPTATGAGGTTFTRRGYAGTANLEVLQAILDRVASGSEGTSITVTNGGTSEDNSSYFLEISGMTAAPFVAISAGADGGSGDVTSVGSGTVDTTGVDDTFLIATFGHDGAPTGFGYTNSFTEEGSVNSGSGGSTHGTRVATRVVSAASTYSTTASWTTAVVASGIVAAYEIAPEPTVPAAPTIVASPYSQDAIKVEITTVGDGGATITDTHMEYRVTSVGGAWTRVSTGDLRTVGYVLGLDPDTQYDIRVIQENSVGESDPSSTATPTTYDAVTQEPLALLAWAEPFIATLPPYGDGSFSDEDRQHALQLPIDPLVTEPSVPGAPTSLGATAIAYNQIDLAWTAPASDGHSAILGYQIERKPAAGSWAIVNADTGNTDTTYTDTGLVQEIEFFYRVSAINALGVGAASNEDSATTPTAPNIAPVADAGPDQTVQVGVLVQLDASGSSDLNDDPLTYLWSFLSKPVGSLAALSSTTAVNPTFLVDIEGTYELQVVVSDSASPPETDSDTLTVTASELAAIIPMYVAAYRPPTVPGNRRTAGVPASTIELWKYPKDLYDVAVDWEADDVLPAGATTLGTLTVVVKNAAGTDVTGTLVASSGVDGFISWAQLQAGTAGLVYDVILTQAFNNGQSLDRYVKIQVRNPRDYVVHAPFKYPADKYPIPVEWAGRRPRGNPALSTLITKAYDASDVDETSTYIAGSFVAGTIGAGYLLGGTGGESRLLEFAQEFNNGRKFHEYAMLTVEVPPA